MRVEWGGVGREERGAGVERCERAAFLWDTSPGDACLESAEAVRAEEVRGGIESERGGVSACQESAL